MSQVFTPTKTNLKAGPKSVICQEAVIVGDVTVEDGTVIHPRASILAEGGPIIIGQNNIIEEQAVIINPVDPNNPDKPKTMTIGSNNLVEVGARVEGSSLGDANVVEIKAQVLYSVVGNGCVVGMGTMVTPNTQLPDDTVIHGPQNQSRIQPNVRENHMGMHGKHLEILWKQLPSYHHMKKN